MPMRVPRGDYAGLLKVLPRAEETKFSTPTAPSEPDVMTEERREELRNLIAKLEERRRHKD